MYSVLYFYKKKNIHHSTGLYHELPGNLLNQSYVLHDGKQFVAQQLFCACTVQSFDTALVQVSYKPEWH